MATATPSPTCSQRASGRSSSSAPELLDVDQAALHLGVSVRFMRRLVFERRIETVRLGRHVRFRRQALDELVTAGTTPAASR